MMKQPAYLLGIETSGITCAVGIANNDQLLVELAAGIKNIHSRVLSRFVNEALEIAGIEAGDLAGVVVSAGPGSFTGLRIGYSVAKGVAHALQKPIIEVPTLDVWAYQTGAQSLPVLSVINAHRGEVFAARYLWKNNLLHRESEYEMLAPEALQSFCQTPHLVAGTDAKSMAAELLSNLPDGSQLANPVAAYPQLWALHSLGFQRFQNDELSDTASCEPMYIRAFKGAS